MKWILVLLLVPCAALADDWREEDTQRQVAYHVLHVIDWRQTQDIARHPDMVESNPILGAHPSNGRINTYMALSAVFVEVVARELPPVWRERFQWVAIIDTYYAVHSNAAVGLKVGF